jgi:mannose-1-phosphate guanylyltransferase
MDYAVIMAGGSGQRLWPLSRKNKPKQIIELFNGLSLLRLCVNRINSLFDPAHILVVTNAEYADVVHEHLPELPRENILGEPVGRNTANAIGLAATVLSQRDPSCTMAVLSADHIIEPVEPLHQAIQESIAYLKEHPQALFTFGIKAAYAHTGFGYLKRGQEISGTEGIFPVEDFKEKPNKSTASKYIRSGDYCWNSGIFVWRVDTILQYINQFLPHNGHRLTRIGKAWNTESRDKILNEEFAELQNISIDYAVMERATEVYMCELDCHWIDVGSYQHLAETIGKNDIDNNATTQGTNVEWIDSTNNIAISQSQDHLIAAIGVDDLAIIHTDDATLICHREEGDNLKDLIKRLEEKGFERFL